MSHFNGAFLMKGLLNTIYSLYSLNIITRQSRGVVTIRVVSVHLCCAVSGVSQTKRVAYFMHGHIEKVVS